MAITSRDGIGSRMGGILGAIGLDPIQKAPTQPITMQQRPAIPQREPLRDSSGGMTFQPGAAMPRPAVDQTMRPDMQISREQLAGGQVSPAKPDMQKAQMASAMVDAIEKKDPRVMNDPTLGDKIKGFFGDQRNMYALAMAFNTMRFKPDQQLGQFLGSQIEGIDKRREANKTLEYLESQNPRLADLVRQGMPIKDALEVLRGGEGKVVGNSLVRLNPQTGEVEVLYQDGGQGDGATTAFRTLQARAREAGLEPGSEEYKRFMIANGSSSGLSIEFNEDGSIKSISEGGSSMPSLTEGQGKATGFYSRMSNAQEILNRTETEGTSLYDSIVNQVPLAGNYLTSPEYKIYDQAKRDFINAILRQESGAAIGKDEFANAEVQYFPQPGDTPQVIAQKRRNRDTAISAIRISGGEGSELVDQLAAQIRPLDKAVPQAPAIGTVKQGYRFTGGDPADRNNWQKVGN